MEELEFDYSADYNFNIMDEIVKKTAKENNLTIGKHISEAKESFFTLSNYFLETIAISDDPVEIVFLIDKYNRARRVWTHYDIYEEQIKLSN